MTTCVCKDCGKKRTRHPLGLCVLCFIQRFGFKEAEPFSWYGRWRKWDWDVEDAA